jgi:hypothetical protein
MTVLKLIQQPEIDQHREALCQWLRDNGINPDNVADQWISIELVDGQQVIRYREYKTTANGQRLIDPDDDRQGWTELRTAPMAVDLDNLTS